MVRITLDFSKSRVDTFFGGGWGGGVGKRAGLGVGTQGSPVGYETLSKSLLCESVACLGNGNVEVNLISLQGLVRTGDWGSSLEHRKLLLREGETHRSVPYTLKWQVKD